MIWASEWAATPSEEPQYCDHQREMHRLLATKAGSILRQPYEARRAVAAEQRITFIAVCCGVARLCASMAASGEVLHVHDFTPLSLGRV